MNKNQQNVAKLCWNPQKEILLENQSNGYCIKIVNGSDNVTPNYNMMFFMDNMVAMKYLLDSGFEGKIDLVYIDPPFLSGEKYHYRSDNNYYLAFDDSSKGTISSYLDMMLPRLKMIYNLLSKDGSIFIHLDWHAIHYVKVLMDEIFGIENYRNEIIVRRGRRKNLLYQFDSIDRMHNANDFILWYSKNPDKKFIHPLSNRYSPSKWMGFWSNVERPTMRYDLFGDDSPSRGQWKWRKSRALKAIMNYNEYLKTSTLPLEKYWIMTGRKLEFIRKREGVKYPEYWIPPKKQTLLDTLWIDIQAYSYSTGYGTEKHTDLLERIVGQFSKKDDLVADFFCGSGTTMISASKMGRRWIGCDFSGVSHKVLQKRLSGIPYSLVTVDSK